MLTAALVKRELPAADVTRVWIWCYRAFGGNLKGLRYILGQLF